MDKKIAGLAGALAVATITPADAAAPAQPSSRAEAYAQLLKPIPNAVAELRTADAAAREEAERRQAEPGTQLAQYWGDDNYYYYHHHHHHHHDYYAPRRRWRWHHHHHHHHHHHDWYHHHHWWGY